MGDAIKKYYDQKSDYGMNSLRRRKISRLAGSAADRPGSRILDVGCAAGYLAKELKRPDNTVVGVDIAGQYAGLLKNQLDGFLVLDVENDRWPDGFSENKFDLIIAAEVLEHLFGQGEFLKGLKEILKPEGEVIISTPNFLLWNNRLRMLFGRYGPKEYFHDCGHIRLLSYNGLKENIKEAGYEIIKEDNIWYPNRLERWSKFLPANLFVFQSIFKMKAI